MKKLIKFLVVVLVFLMMTTTVFADPHGEPDQPNQPNSTPPIIVEG